MEYTARGAQCGAITTASGERKVVVAGGHDTGERVQQEVQVLDLASGTWSLGPFLPYSIWLGAVLPTERSFLILGGAQIPAGSATDDKILELDPDTLEWIERPERLSMERSAFYSINVEKSLFCS